MKPEFSRHALEQMELRCISEELVRSIVKYPDSIVNQDETVMIYSKLVIEKSKTYLYRVSINHLKRPALIITVYKTSKIEKYGDQI